METQVGGAAPAPEETTTKPERQVGPETRAVRIFREVFAQDAAAAKHLKPSLDRYLKLVLDDPSAKRGDKTYARKIYADLLRQFGVNEPQGLPEWAKKPPEETLSDKDIQDILSAADNPPPVPPQVPFIPEGVTVGSGGITMTGPIGDGRPFVAVIGDEATVIPADPGMALDPLDDLLDETPLAPHPVEIQCKKFLDELMESNQLPFVRVFTLHREDFFGMKSGLPPEQLPEGIPGPGRYVALGTVLGTITQGKHTGKKVNIHCTIAGYRRLRDAEKDHFVYINGRPLVVSEDDPKSGLRKYIFCLRHKAGMKIRYWTRINDKDAEDRARFFVLSDDDQGVRGLTREQF